MLGQAGHDHLVGGTGDDWLNGYGGDSDRDRLVGKSGADVFVLGDQVTAFYQGIGWATIPDFSRFEGDTILLHGCADDYHLKQTAQLRRMAVNTSIYHNGTLLAVVQDSPNLSLASDFTFI